MRRDAAARVRRNALGLAALTIAAWWMPTEAHAFCLTTTCDPGAEDCDPPEGSECTSKGSPLYWPGACVGYHLQKDGATEIPFEVFQSTTAASFSAWLVVDCGDGKGPSIHVEEQGTVSCGEPEYNQRAGNANIIMFRDDAWPYSNATHTLGLTTVTFNTQTAEIYDVDMEINSAQVDLSTGDSEVQYDLQSIVTHEAGHFLGLAHSGDPTATMYAKYKKGTVALRTLEADDVEGICEAYPSARTAAACDFTPRHGLQDTCGEGPAPTDEGCAIRPRRSAHNGLGALAVAMAALIAARRRRWGR